MAPILSCVLPSYRAVMSSPISPFNQALRALQVQLAQARTVAANPAPDRAAGRVPASGATVQAPALSSAMQGLRTQLRAACDAQGRLPSGKALRLFVQAALLDELGASFQLDPALGDWVERTCQAIEQDPGNATLLGEALQELARWVD